MEGPKLPPATEEEDEDEEDDDEEGGVGGGGWKEEEEEECKGIESERERRVPQTECGGRERFGSAGQGEKRGGGEDGGGVEEEGGGGHALGGEEGFVEVELGDIDAFDSPALTGLALAKPLAVTKLN
jgi:hypothetical protein